MTDKHVTYTAWRNVHSYQHIDNRSLMIQRHLLNLLYPEDSDETLNEYILIKF